jgi:hypothetical protein
VVTDIGNSLSLTHALILSTSRFVNGSNPISVHFVAGDTENCTADDEEPPEGVDHEVVGWVAALIAVATCC